jgi:hypothetical protein
MKLLKKIGYLFLLFFMYSNSSAQEPGMVSLNSKPAGARVILNGEDTEKTTPFQKAFSPGNYEYRLVHENFRDYSGTFTVKESDLTIVNVELNPIYGILGVIAYPDAEIYVDGERVGNRVFTGHVSLGSHTVTISKEGYLTEETIVVIEEGEDINLRFELKKDSEKPVFENPVNAEYIQNGKSAAKRKDSKKRTFEDPIYAESIRNKEKPLRNRQNNFFIKPYAGLSTSHGFNSTNQGVTQVSNSSFNSVQKELIKYGDSQYIGGAFGFWIKNFGIEFTYQHIIDYYFQNYMYYEYSSSTISTNTKSNYFGKDENILGLSFLIRYPNTPFYLKSGLNYRLNPQIGYIRNYYYQKQDDSNYIEISEVWTYYLDKTLGYQGGLGLDINVFKFLSLFIEGIFTMFYSPASSGYLNYKHHSFDREYFNRTYRNQIDFKDYYNSPESGSNYLDHPREIITREYNLSSLNVIGGLSFKF